MKIHGLNKTTLLDYPGRVAATIFLGGCNFRCPFCHNGGLVLDPDSQPEIPVDEVLAFLKKRRGILDGVCITGGEPTLAADLEDFVRKVRALGYPVKLDTNGTRPQVVKNLAEKELVQMVAMDIKAAPSNYAALCGLDAPRLDSVRETAEFLMNGAVDYEFRTTAVRELHTEKDFVEIGQWLAGAKAYYLQAYRDSGEILKPGFSSYSVQDLERFRDILRQTMPLVELRGID